MVKKKNVFSMEKTVPAKILFAGKNPGTDNKMIKITCNFNYKTKLNNAI